MTKHKRIILVALSDLHAGFKLALMNPKVELYDEQPGTQPTAYSPKPTASQEYLWKIYVDMSYVSRVKCFLF